MTTKGLYLHCLGSFEFWKNRHLTLPEISRFKNSFHNFHWKKWSLGNDPKGVKIPVTVCVPTPAMNYFFIIFFSWGHGYIRHWCPSFVSRPTHNGSPRSPRTSGTTSVKICFHKSLLERANTRPRSHHAAEEIISGGNLVQEYCRQYNSCDRL